MDAGVGAEAGGVVTGMVNVGAGEGAGAGGVAAAAVGVPEVRVPPLAANVPPDSAAPPRATAPPPPPRAMAPPDVSTPPPTAVMVPPGEEVPAVVVAPLEGLVGPCRGVTALAAWPPMPVWLGPPSILTSRAPSGGGVSE